MLKHREKMTPKSGRQSKMTKTQSKTSVCSYDYEHITPYIIGRNKSSLKVRSIENGLDRVGPPKAVWSFNDNQINVYDELTPSEMGLHDKNNDRKFFLSASMGNVTISSSFVSTEFSGHDFVDDERSSYNDDGSTIIEHSIRHNEMYEPVRTSTQKLLETETRPVAAKRTSTLKKNSSLEGSIVSNPIWNKSQKVKEPIKLEESVEVQQPIVVQQQPVKQAAVKSQKESEQPPPLPKNPPSTRKTSKKKIDKTPKSVAYQARIRPEYRCEPTIDPSFYKADQYVPQFYHERFWQNPQKLEPLMINPDYSTAQVTHPKAEQVSVEVEAKIGEETLKELQRQQRKEQKRRIHENEKTLRKNQEIIEAVAREAELERDEKVKENSKLLTSSITKQLELKRLIQEKKRRAEKRRLEKKRREKRTKEVQRQLERAQQKQEAKMREAKKNMNDSELEHYKEQVETLKRLAAEKEALLIQKSINESQRSNRSRSTSSSIPINFNPGQGTHLLATQHETQSIASSVSVQPVQQEVPIPKKRGSKKSSTLTTAGVQTGRTSQRNSSSSVQVDITKRESQLSFNLSDLSDEEVDRRITRLTIEIENEPDQGDEDVFTV